MFQQTEACGILASTNITCSPLTEIQILTTAARDNLYLDVAHGRVENAASFRILLCQDAVCLRV